MSRIDNDTSPVALGVSIFAGAALITVGFFQIIEAISALAKDELFVVGEEYVFNVDLTTWGWIHLVLGILLIVVGAGVLASQGWALLSGMAVAVASAVVNFAWLPYFPWWGIAIIALDVWIIWALGKLYVGRD